VDDITKDHFAKTKEHAHTWDTVKLFTLHSPQCSNQNYPLATRGGDRGRTTSPTTQPPREYRHFCSPLQALALYIDHLYTRLNKSRANIDFRKHGWWVCAVQLWTPLSREWNNKK